jgi:multidrug efflux system outer membrane protein
MNLSARLSNPKHQRRVIARVIICGMLLVLTSCQIPKLRPAELGLALPPNFNGAASADNSAQLRVDEFYNDPVLTRLICQAVANNRELWYLNEEIRIAQNEILARRGAYLPFVGFRGSAGFDKSSEFMPLGQAERQLKYFPGKHFPDPLPNFLAGLNIFWQLDIWRELRNARDAAIQRFIAATERRNYFVTRLVADIAENYYGLVALDQRILNLDRIIDLQQRSLLGAEANFKAGRDSELPVQRFRAEVRKNQSEKLIVRQEIIEVENRINFLAGRVPQSVERMSAVFFDFNIHALSVGVPAQLLQYRPDIRQAERELVAAGIDIKVARAHFFPRLDLSAGVGYQAFNPKYLLMSPEALIANVAGDLTAPLVNRAAIRADFMSANARQLESIYNYQRVIINAFTEVVNRLSMVQNYGRSIEIKKLQLQALEAAVVAATQLFNLPREKSHVDYLDLLTTQRDLLEARRVLIDTKRQQLSAIVNTYQALGGGALLACSPQDMQFSVPEPQQLPEVQRPLPPEVPPMLAPQRPPQIEQLPAPRELPQPPAPGKEKKAP